MAKQELSEYARSIRNYKRVGLTMIFLVSSTFGLWATTAPLSSAVVASGHFEVDGNIKKVQHQTGGVISEIRVHEGDRVKEGQILVRLDPTMAKSNLEIVTHQLVELNVSAARLRAERDGASQFFLPNGLELDAPAFGVARLYASELKLFAARIDARRGQQNQLLERIAQLEKQIAGIGEQVKSKKRERQLLADELDGLRELLKKNLVAVGRVNELDRAAANLDGEIGQLDAAEAEQRGKIAETHLQILNLDQVSVADANKELRDTESKINELQQRQVEAADVLNRVDIKAPRAGIVHLLAVHTVGGVVGAGDVLMNIVPETSPLTIEVRISPRDVDAIHRNDKAFVRIAGLNRATAPDLVAKVDLIAADLALDPATHTAYYPVRISLAPGQIARLNGTPLVPGMPVDAYITTSERTFANYIMEPVLDRLSRAIREK